MGRTILEVLYGVQYSFRAGSSKSQQSLGRRQLHDAIELLKTGKGIEDDFDEDDLREMESKHESY